MSTSSRNKNFGEVEKISIGYVSAAHGVRGEVCVTPLTDFPDRFDRMGFLDLYLNGALARRLCVTRVRHKNRGELIVESDVLDRNEAEKLVGALIQIDRKDRVPLPEGHFWVEDLIGLSVFDVAGNVLGVVEDLIPTGGSDVYAIKDEAGKLHYIPAAAEFVKDIDTDFGRIVVELIEGLW